MTGLMITGLLFGCVAGTLLIGILIYIVFLADSFTR